MKSVIAIISTFAEAGPTRLLKLIGKQNFQNYFSEQLSYDNNPFIPQDDARRYNQFKTMFQHFYSNEQLAKTYGYGCYCLNLGDRPLSGVMTGE